MSCCIQIIICEDERVSEIRDVEEMGSWVWGGGGHSK